MKADDCSAADSVDSVPSPSRPDHYSIRLQGLLNPRWDWLQGFTVTHLETGETLLCRPVVDQAALHGLLARIRDLNLTLISVNRTDPEDQ